MNSIIPANILLLTRHFCLIASLIAVHLTTSAQSSVQQADINSGLTDQVQTALDIRFTSPDSATLLFTKSYMEFLSRGDTANAITCMVDLSFHHAHNANYVTAYDGYWEALLLADRLDRPELTARVYSGLGWLYSFFEREGLAKDYFDESIRLFKSINDDTFQFSQPILDNYYALATLFTKNGENQLARTYLDSCRFIQIQRGDTANSNMYLEAQEAYILFNEGKYDESKQLILASAPFFEQALPSYLVLLYSYLADVYAAKSNFEEGEKFYLKSLDIGNQYKSHQDLIPGIHERLSQLYYAWGKYDKAYESINTSKQLNELQFGSRSQKNKQILEIKDNFRQIRSEQNKRIQEQRLSDLEQKEKINRLTSQILYITVLSLVFMLFITYRFLRNRFKARRMVLQKQQQLEMEKAQEVLEVKNKELTASALQVIERDEMLAQLKERLNDIKKAPDQVTIGKIAKSIDLNHAKNWNDFNARFTSVNHKFYDNLSDLYPNLSQGDKKICALIKLNFSSKDMARLLGISVESVHTTRYRLRKKLGLERQDNLEDHIASI
ncbi:MAG: hypothetical protein JXQ90_10935 [Cyclobacteriaceae bacterium]